MKILVSGADGFVGRHLNGALLAAGHSLKLGVRADRGQIDLSGDVEVVGVGNVGAETDWRGALDGVDCVINLVGRAHVLKEDASDPQKAFNDINCHGTLGLFRAAREMGVQNFLHLSSVHVLGLQTEEGTAFDDNTIPAPDSDYGRSKLNAETGLAALAGDYSGSLVILRPPLIVGAGARGNLERMDRWLKKPILLPFAGIKNRRTLICVENLVSAMLAVLNIWQSQSVSGTYLVGDRTPVSTTQILQSIKEGSGGRALLFPLPQFVLTKLLQLAGGEKLVTQLTGNLEVDCQGFQRDFFWQPQRDTVAGLIAMGQRKHG
ncbi:MAG TPA: NAD-dependent epimerase/dehydratase family protein [Devosia sp.]|nr:NAD-dependent epimerase/dehydratase family protein [Devosia sp.]